MKKIIIQVEDIEILATLNDTMAANDIYSKLPLSLLFTDSGVDYCCKYLQGNYTIDEMQRGWQNGDIVWNGGFLSIIYFDQKYSSGYNVMVIGHIEKEDLKILKKLSKKVLIEFKPV